MVMQSSKILRPERARRTASFPARTEHKMVDKELGFPVEEFRKGFIAVLGVENVFLLNLDPWQLSNFGSESVA